MYNNKNKMKKVISLSKNSFKEKTLYILIIIWVSLSIFYVLYNSVKAFSEIKNWIFLTDFEKKQEIFGDIYLFLVFVGNNTENNSNILIYSQDVKTFYLGAYYLYPRLIAVVDNKKDFNLRVNSGNFKYAAVFNSGIKPEKYKSVISDSLGSIYKK